MSIIKEVTQAWRRDGVALNPGASGGELELLNQLFHCEVPADIREFYADANGMPDHVYDEHHVSFWSIAKIREQRHAWGDAEIGFADFLIDSWRFIFRVDGDSVIVVSENVAPGSPLECLGSFSNFLNLYVTRPDALRIL